jgi:hypothetical protein
MHAAETGTTAGRSVFDKSGREEESFDPGPGASMLMLNGSIAKHASCLKQEYERVRKSRRRICGVLESQARDMESFKRESAT